MNTQPKTRTSARRYNDRMEKIWSNARRIEAERITRGERPNPNLTTVNQTHMKLTPPNITPGDWKVSFPEDHHTRQECDIYSTAHGGCFPAICQRVPEMKANSRAIAALPVILEKLAYALKYPRAISDNDGFRQEVIFALALAGYTIQPD